MKKLFAVLFITLLLNSSAPISSAQEAEAEEDFSASDKFTRSVVNIATFYLEVPKTVYETTRDENIVTGLLYGIPMGFAKGAIRLVSGVIEFGTFPLEPFEPILEPEFLLLER
ncbi:MAG: exosortase system-associated protein, TIGR04073 family [Candidatus Omnitrophota bacterium]